MSTRPRRISNLKPRFLRFVNDTRTSLESHIKNKYDVGETQTTLKSPTSNIPTTLRLISNLTSRVPRFVNETRTSLVSRTSFEFHIKSLQHLASPG